MLASSVRISVPLVECLVDDVRYFRPDTLPPPAGDDLRLMSSPRITKAPRAQARRTCTSGMAERAGFEPAVDLRLLSFQDCCLKRLGHLSKLFGRRFSCCDPVVTSEGHGKQ